MGQSQPSAISLFRRIRRGMDALLGSETSDAGEIRSYRLILFSILGTTMTGFYTVHDYRLGSWATSALHATAFLSTLLSLLLNLRYRKQRLAAHVLLYTMTLLLGLVPMWDGAIYAPGLWCIVIVPMAAALLFGERGVLQYGIAALAMTLLNAAIGRGLSEGSEITRTPEQWAQMRYATLIVYSTLGLASTNASLRRRRTLAQRTQALEQEARDANVAERSKSAFLATMSHEIRMPMQGLVELAQRLKAVAYPSDLQVKVDTIRASSLRLLKLLDGVLDLANLESGNVELQSVEFSMSELLNRLHDDYSGAAQNKNLRLRTQINLGPRLYMGDPRRIYQVLGALIDNAIKFSDAGQIEILAQTMQDKTKDLQRSTNLRITVRDQGIGMTQKQLSRVFDRFEQGHDERGGCGLGLAVANRLVQCMQGSLRAESQPQQGTSFTLSIELEEPVDDNSDDSWSRALGLENLESTRLPKPPVASSPEAPREVSMSRRTLMPLATVTTPFVCMLAFGALWPLNRVAAGIHAFALLAMLGSLLTFRKRTHHLARLLLFSSGLGASIFAQSLAEGTIHSSALWSLGLLPIFCAYLFNIHAALVVLTVSIGVITVIASQPNPPLDTWFATQNLWSTLVLRCTSLLAHAGAALVITRGSRETLAAMQIHQLSVARIHQQAKRSNLEKDRFLSRISSEFGVPLRRIVELSHELIRPHQHDTTLNATLKTVATNAAHLNDLVEQTLSSAAGEQEHFNSRSEDFDLCELVNQARNLFEPTATQEGQRIEIIHSHPSLWIHGSPNAIVEITAVLLSNAIRFSHQGATIWIELRAIDGPEGAPNSLEIEIRDEGTGISADRLAEIMNSTGTSVSESAQAHLPPNALARTIKSAQTMGGELRAHSCLGQGSSFILCIPYQAPWSELRLAA